MMPTIRRSVLALETCEERITPDSEPSFILGGTAGSSFLSLRTTEHIDVGVDFEQSAWQLSAEVGSPNPSDPAVDFPLEHTLFYGHPSTRRSIPNDARFAFTGAQGGELYVLQQTQVTGELFLGFASEETPPQTFQSYLETDPRVAPIPFPWITVQIVDARGPGEFSMWQTSGGGSITPFTSTFEGGLDASDKYFSAPGTHTHLNWGFSEPGFYEIDIQASALVSDINGNNRRDDDIDVISTSPVTTLYFSIDAPLQVTSITPTTSGLIARFNRPIDPSILNLNSDQEAADVMLLSDGPDNVFDTADDVLVGGNLTIPTGLLPTIQGGFEQVDALNVVEFTRTGGPLPPGEYRLTLRGDGLPYAESTSFRTTAMPVEARSMTEDFVHTFTVDALPELIVGIPDFARGPGQTVDLPATNPGIPLTLSATATVNGLERIELELDYNPTFLEISRIDLGPDAPADANLVTASIDPVAGQIRIDLQTASTPLSIGADEVLTLFTLTASVPSDLEIGPRQGHRLDLSQVRINDGNVDATADDGVHALAYFGDVDGDGRFTVNDASLLLGIAAGRTRGLANLPWFDARLVADIDGSGSISVADVSVLLAKAAGRVVPLIPDIP